MKVLFTLVKEKKEGDRVTLQAGDIAFSELIRQHEKSPRPQVTVAPQDPSLILFTGAPPVCRRRPLPPTRRS